jgi:hypothetical protein
MYLARIGIRLLKRLDVTNYSPSGKAVKRNVAAQDASTTAQTPSGQNRQVIPPSRLTRGLARTPTFWTDGAFSDDGAFHPLETWDGDAVMKRFRERLRARLIERHAISEELTRRLLAWRHPGFSAHVGDAIPFEDKKAIEDVACYVVRNPLSLKKLIIRCARVNRARLI